MKKVLLATTFLIYTTFLTAQNVTITGKVVDAITKDALEFATISFVSSKTNQTFGGIANNKGKFNFKVPKGTYDVFIEFLAYKTIHLSSIEISENKKFGTLKMQEDTETLEILNITGTKKTIEIKPKKTIYNVAQDVAAEGSSLTTVLSNIPTVNINNDGAASIAGKEATIMINGKISILSKASVLESLPAGSVEKVEVISNPSVAYNSSFKSILNIITKKGKNTGLNGAVTVNGGFKDIYGALVNINNKTKKVNFYTNLSYAHKNKIRISDAKNSYFNGVNIASYLNENSEFNSKYNNFTGTIGADFYASKKTTLTGIVNYINYHDKNNTLTNSSILDATQIETLTNRRNNDELFDNNSIEIIGEMKHDFKKEGSSLTVSVTHFKDLENFDTKVTNSDSNFTNETYTQSNEITNTLTKINYVTPTGAKTKLSLGYEGNLGDAPFRNSITNGNIDYTEDIHAAFALYEYEADTFYIDGGLRGETSNTNIDYLDANTTINRKLNKIFVSTYSQYVISDSKFLVFSYESKIGRVAAPQLQPFEERYSETSSYIGNILLKPVYSDNFLLEYRYFGDKFTVMPSLIYSKYNDYWQTVTYQTGEQINGINKLLTTIDNVGYLNYYRFNLTTMYRASNALNFTFDGSLEYFDVNGTYETVNAINQPININFDNQNITGNLKLITQVKLPKTLNLQATIFHYLKSTAAISSRKAYTYASFSMNKRLLDKKATLSLNINDIFNSNQTKRDRFDVNYFSSSLIKNKYPDIILSFTYRFNNSKNSKKINYKGKDKKPHY